MKWERECGSWHGLSRRPIIVFSGLHTIRCASESAPRRTNSTTHPRSSLTLSHTPTHMTAHTHVHTPIGAGQSSRGLVSLPLPQTRRGRGHTRTGKHDTCSLTPKNYGSTQHDGGPAAYHGQPELQQQQHRQQQQQQHRSPACDHPHGTRLVLVLLPLCAFRPGRGGSHAQGCRRHATDQDPHKQQPSQPQFGPVSQGAAAARAGRSHPTPRDSGPEIDRQTPMCLINTLSCLSPIHP